MTQTCLVAYPHQSGHDAFSCSGVACDGDGVCEIIIKPVIFPNVSSCPSASPPGALGSGGRFFCGTDDYATVSFNTTPGASTSASDTGVGTQIDFIKGFLTSWEDFFPAAVMMLLVLAGFKFMSRVKNMHNDEENGDGK